jgi:hypothetical protein
MAAICGERRVLGCSGSGQPATVGDVPTGVAADADDVGEEGDPDMANGIALAVVGS